MKNILWNISKWNSVPRLKYNISRLLSRILFLTSCTQNVAEGAIHYLQSNFGEGREYVLRCHYGIQVAVPFIIGYHSEIFKFEGQDGGFIASIMQWPVRKVIIIKFRLTYRDKRLRMGILFIFHCRFLWKRRI